MIAIILVYPQGKEQGGDSHLCFQTANLSFPNTFFKHFIVLLLKTFVFYSTSLHSKDSVHF